MGKKVSTFVIPPPETKCLWRCNQVQGSGWLSPEDIEVGMEIGLYEHAMREFFHPDIPAEMRFIRARVVEITKGEDPTMKLEWVKPSKEITGLGWAGSLKFYAKFCVRADGKEPDSHAKARGAFKEQKKKVRRKSSAEEKGGK